MRRLLFPLFWLLEFLLVAVGAALLALWFWSGSEGSLKSALEQGAPYLPGGQQLQLQNVTGSLRDGGAIGQLRWQSGAVTVQARQVRFAWRPMALLQRQLHVTSLELAELSIDDQRTPGAAEPLQELVLPINLDIAFQIDRIRLTGTNTVDVNALTGAYRYDSDKHQLTLKRLQIADGHYQGQLALQARSPMTLDVQLQGAVQAPIGDERQVALDATATLRGPLAGTVPNLDLLAQLQPAAGNTGELAASRAMRATVSAQINPWASQPVVRAHASFTQLNLAALWPTAPRTQLTGSTSVQPAGVNWRAEVNLVNRAAGPWDKGQLPVDSLKALVDLTDGRWRIQSLNAEAGGGRIRLVGSIGDPQTVSATSGWQGQLQLQSINPALLHSQMESVRLNGTLDAKAESGGVAFDAELKPSAQQDRGSILRGLRLQTASARGRWADGWVRVEDLIVRTSDARLDGKVDLQLAALQARGRLRLVAPGAQAQLSGQLAAQDGAGDLTLNVTDAAALRRWVVRLPNTPKSLGEFDVQGNAELALRWTGGWESFLKPDRGKPASLQARLQIPALAVRLDGQNAAQTLRLRDVDTELAGTLDALTFKTRAQLVRDGQQLQLQADGRGGRDGRGDWLASVNHMQLQAKAPQIPGPWALALNKPLELRWSAATAPGSGPALRVGAAQASLTGPQAGTLTLDWQPVVWDAGARTSLTSKGSIRGLPMGWIALLGNTKPGDVGLSGDLVFDGKWDVTLTDTLLVRATLARRSGDIRIQTDAAPATASGGVGSVNAGVREATLELQADGDTVQGNFRWDSERAGNAQASLSTRLRRTEQGWTWTPDSPLNASLRARLPQVGVWSMLAPPGWRVRGTVDADLALSGTQRSPQWSGSLRADELAVRSVVDGIEFGNGQLRASLLGERLNIDSFSLQGAGGAAGGELNATGYARWTVATAPGNSGLGGIELQLDALAKALRVSARADRRLAVSGTVQARLAQSKLRIRGALTVDQALFILPDETAPSLGDDVVVVRRNAPQATVSAKTPPTANAPRLATDLLVTLDLGRDFSVRGRGIDTRVVGELTLRSQLLAGEAPTLTGELRTVGGRFQAYGQQLQIDRGVMRFAGAYDNPSLNILAIRPKLTRRVGVQITGTALLPRIRLYAEPDLPEAEKLAWLVLGRSAAGGGAEAAVLQQAAMALLGGQNQSGGIAGRLGLDELSFSGASDVGSGGAGAATITLGKRISQDFYVAYERSLAGTLGTFSIFYDLSERFTLRARTGEKSAIDLVYKFSYD